MTLPTDIILPLQTDLIKAGDPKSLELYLRQLVESLTESYRITAQNVNGSIQTWAPIVYGTTSEGTGTYIRQNGWYRRSGLMTQLWMDVAWSAHTGTGDLAILLPFKAANSEGNPWVGVIQSVSASNTFGAGFTYLVWNATPNTTESLIIRCGTGVASDELPLASGRAFIGYIEYIGQEFEN